MSAPVNSNNPATISRPSIYEYAAALTALQQLLQEPPDPSDPQAVAAYTMQVSSLYQELQTIQNMDLTQAPDMQQLIGNVLAATVPLTSAINSGSYGNLAALLTQWQNTAGPAIANALNSSNWDPTLQLSSAFNDKVFYQFFRTAEANMDVEVGQFGNAMQVQQEVLTALNQVYSGVTWNPGSQYISTTGALRDVSPTNTWFAQFTQDGIATTMSDGIAALQQIVASGVFPAGSPQLTGLNSIIQLFSLPSTNGGFESVDSATNASAMWSDTDFGQEVDSAITIASNISEQSQEELSQVLFIYQSETEGGITWAKKMNDMMTTVAHNVSG